MWCWGGEGKAALGFLWAWCENQVAAAMKLVPLGQAQDALEDQRVAAVVEVLGPEEVGHLGHALVVEQQRAEQRALGALKSAAPSQRS